MGLIIKWSHQWGSNNCTCANAISGLLLRASYQQIYCLKEILSLAETSTEHKYLKLVFKVHSPKELAGFNNEPAEGFLSYIPEFPKQV